LNLFWILLIAGLVLVLILVYNDRVLMPQRAKKGVEKLLRQIREGKIKPRHFDKSIIFDEDGVVISDDKSGERSAHIIWSEVVRVIAYKRDLFNVDQICVFLSRSDETGMEVQEDLNNWTNFITSLPEHLPNCKRAESWLEDVTLPAFAANVTELYSRPNNLSQIKGAK